MTTQQTSFGTAPISPRRGESAQLFDGIVRKHTDPKRWEMADSEQSEPDTEPHAHTPLKPVRVFQEPRMDSEGNPLVLCRFCGESAVRAIDDKYNKVVYLDWVPGNGGKFLVRNGRAHFWGAGQPYVKHRCRLETHQDQAAV